LENSSTSHGTICLGEENEWRRCCSYWHMINFVRLTFSLCPWKQNHIEFLFACLYQNTGFETHHLPCRFGILLFLHLGFILGIFLWFFIFSLSLSLGCETHLSEKKWLHGWHVRRSLSLLDLLRVTHSNEGFFLFQ
jgi:hypothetical protein